MSMSHQFSPPYALLPGAQLILSNHRKVSLTFAQDTTKYYHECMTEWWYEGCLIMLLSSNLVSTYTFLAAAAVVAHTFYYSYLLWVVELLMGLEDDEFLPS